jgi:hypothetical protein
MGIYMIKRLILIFVSLVLTGATCFSQVSIEKPTKENELTQTQLIWLNDLRVLETESSKIEAPLARALAKTEIAAAAWDLDKTWSKELLRNAYELTFPDDDQQARLRETPAGSPPVLPTSVDRARNAIVHRVLQVASRDRVFADSLAQLSKDRLGAYEAHLRYTTLASQAFNDGDKDRARSLLLSAIDADPTQITAGLVIRDIAGRDRALADAIIIQYIDRLRAFPLSRSNQSLVRVFFTLSGFMFPQSTPDQQVVPPGVPVMRAYIGFVIDTVTKLEYDPTSLQAANAILMLTWPLLSEYAPDLINVFLSLEQRSRVSGGSGLQKADSIDEMYRTYKARNDQRINNSLESDKPDEAVITLAVNQRDFAKARKMIDKLPDGDQKAKLVEFLNVNEALTSVAKDDIPAAQGFAERLNDATSILKVYPAIVSKCVADKNQVCVNDVVLRAMKQLRSANNKFSKPPAGIAASSVANDREVDPVLLSLSRFAKAITPINEALAWDILDELVLSATRSQVDTSQGRTGFEADTFKLLGQKNETRAYQAANNLKDRLERIVALANIYQGLSDAQAKSPSPRGPRRSPLKPR